MRDRGEIAPRGGRDQAGGRIVDLAAAHIDDLRRIGGCRSGSRVRSVRWKSRRTHSPSMMKEAVLGLASLRKARGDRRRPHGSRIDRSGAGRNHFRTAASGLPCAWRVSPAAFRSVRLRGHARGGAVANKIDLGGKNAVVTGGAQGIGRAIVERLLDPARRSRSGPRRQARQEDRRRLTLKYRHPGPMPTGVARRKRDASGTRQHHRPSSFPRMITMLRRTLLHCAAAAALVVTVMMAWPVSAASATALPRESNGTVATTPIDARSGDGGCSSPLGSTRWGFAAACELHDHRYDLLRQAAARGTPLPQSARRAADAAFAEQLDARCDARHGLDAVGCHITARLYTGAVAGNSWRQEYGPPLFEPALPWLVGSGIAVVLATSVGLGLAGHVGAAAQPTATRSRPVGDAA